jgi:hypothetical protein
MNITYQKPVNVKLTFIKPDGSSVEGPTITLQPDTRQTVRVNDYVADSVSTIVEATVEESDPVAGEPEIPPKIIVERAMYMSGSMNGATDSLGYSEN